MFSTARCGSELWLEGESLVVFSIGSRDAERGIFALRKQHARPWAAARKREMARPERLADMSRNFARKREDFPSLNSMGSDPTPKVSAMKMYQT
jgi:hypothetical protein